MWYFFLPLQSVVIGFSFIVNLREQLGWQRGKPFIVKYILLPPASACGRLSVIFCAFVSFMMNACKEKLLWDKSLFWALHNLRGDFLTFKILTVNMAYLRAFGNLFMLTIWILFYSFFLKFFMSQTVLQYLLGSFPCHDNIKPNFLALQRAVPFGNPETPPSPFFTSTFYTES